jgi:6-phosphogluconolactonase
VARAEVVVYRDLEELSSKAAAEFVRLANERSATVGRFAVALSGGSTPRALYSLLAGDEFQSQVPWNRVHFFWGDERCVPPEHPDSNYRMAFETLLSKAPVPEKNIHRIEGEEKPEIAAAKYEKAIRDFFQLADSELPRFDLILLGLGDDGHTASLFPGSEALQETRRLAVATYVEKLKSHRVTLTLPVLNHAANIFFLVAGENKTGILKDVLQRESSKNFPAQQIDPPNGRLVWFVDQAADASLQS